MPEKSLLIFNFGDFSRQLQLHSSNAWSFASPCRSLCLEGPQRVLHCVTHDFHRVDKLLGCSLFVCPISLLSILPGLIAGWFFGCISWRIHRRIWLPISVYFVRWRKSSTPVLWSSCHGMSLLLYRLRTHLGLRSPSLLECGDTCWLTLVVVAGTMCLLLSESAGALAALYYLHWLRGVPQPICRTCLWRCLEFVRSDLPLCTHSLSSALSPGQPLSLIVSAWHGDTRPRCGK